MVCVINQQWSIITHKVQLIGCMRSLDSVIFQINDDDDQLEEWSDKGE